MGLRHGLGALHLRDANRAQGSLEGALSKFLRTDDSILYSSCFDANGGLFETLLGEEDAVISDELNHASIVDGIRLCKAKRYRYRNNDMRDLEAKLQEADSAGARFKLIATDGVFSMDGIIADLRSICSLADRHGALVMVDDSHAVGFVGDGGRGTPEYCGVEANVDIITGTLGKALGGAAGGYTSGRKEIVELLRQRSRPYLFSNTVPPCIAATTLKVLELVDSEEGRAMRQRVHENGEHFRKALTALGFDLVPGHHPDHSGDARRRGARDARRECASRRRRVRDRIFVSRGAQGQSAAADPDERCAQSGPDRTRRRRFCQGREDAWRHSLKKARMP